MISLQIVKTSIAYANNDFYLDNSYLIKIGHTVTLEITESLRLCASRYEPLFLISGSFLKEFIPQNREENS